MNDFSEPYRQAVFFGIWAEETADKFGKRDALNILKDAVDQCQETDMRTPEVFEALRYLERSATRRGQFKRFRQALELPNPEDRAMHAGEAYRGMMRVLGERE